MRDYMKDYHSQDRHSIDNSIFVYLLPTHDDAKVILKNAKGVEMYFRNHQPDDTTKSVSGVIARKVLSFGISSVNVIVNGNYGGELASFVDGLENRGINVGYIKKDDIIIRHSRQTSLQRAS
ncbi:MAG: hypothetical protein FWD33_01880 [Alphaproteobacteria bacterium]|nr:hypothetical protein [Alphaproteobacteria bacterium]